MDDKQNQAQTTVPPGQVKPVSTTQPPAPPLPTQEPPQSQPSPVLKPVPPPPAAPINQPPKPSAPPANLPIVEPKPLTPPVATVSPPPLPPAPKPAASNQPGVTSGPSPKPVPPPITQTPSEPLSFRSSIRTMRDDLDALKKGQRPSGFELEKQIEKTPIQAPSATPATPSLTPHPQIKVELGETQRAKTLGGLGGPTSVPKPSVEPKKPMINIPKPTPTPPLAVPKPPQTPSKIPVPDTTGLKVPQGGSPIFSKRNIFIGGGAILIIAIAVWFFYFRSGNGTIVQNTRTPSPTAPLASSIPSPTPSGQILQSKFEKYLSGISSSPITITTASGSYGALNTFVNSKDVSTGELTFYRVTDATANPYQLTQFFSLFPVSLPNDLGTLTQNQEFLFSIFGMVKQGQKSIGFIVPVSDPAGAKTAMSAWEKTLSGDIGKLFTLNLKKQASKTFLDNIYNGVAIRYLNFPDPDSTIDYAVFTLQDGTSLLIVTDSKLQIYSIIDQIRNR